MAPLRRHVSGEIAWCDPLDARLTMSENVVLEEAGPGRWTLTSVHTAGREAALRLQVSSAPGAPTLPVRVLEAVPVVVDGAIRYRITVGVIEAPAV